MKTITHRQLRNNSAAVLRDVEAGESLLISNHGVVVARIGPASEPEPSLPVSRAATVRGVADLPMHHRPEATLDVLAELRGER